MEYQSNHLLEHVTLLTVYDADIQRLENRVGKDRAANTLKAFKQSRKYLGEFLVGSICREDIELLELTPQFINDFSIWLSAERGLHGGTVWLATMQLKGVVTRAHQRGLLTWNPFAGFRQAKNIRPREYLNEEEIGILMQHSFSKPYLSKARDIFVLGCFTGLSFVDIQELSSKTIVVVNGSFWIVSKRHKTKVPFEVKLLPPAVNIIKKYMREDNPLIFPGLQYRTLAKQLKIVMSLCGIQKRISMHCARHSFAVLALNRGMPIESVSRVLGHMSIKTTQIYAKLTMQKLDSDFDALAERLHLI